MSGFGTGRFASGRFGSGRFGSGRMGSGAMFSPLLLADGLAWVYNPIDDLTQDYLPSKIGDEAPNGRKIQPGRSYTGQTGAYIEIIGLLTTDTISVPSGSATPTCTSDDRLDIANGDEVWQVTIKRAGVTIGFYKMDETAGDAGTNTTCYNSISAGSPLPDGSITSATLSTWFTTNPLARSYQNEFGYTDSSGVLIPRDESSTNLDAAGNALQYSGHVKYHAVPKASNCGTWDGADHLVTVSANAAIDFNGKTAYSVEGWINPSSDGEGNLGRIIQKGNNLFHLQSEAGGFTELYVKIDCVTTDALAQTSTAVVPIGSDTHVGMVYNRLGTKKIEIYINGVLQTLGTDQAGVGAIVDDSANDLIIGNDPTAVRTFDGKIYDLNFYPNTALAATDMLAKYNQTSISSTPTASYPISEGAGKDIFDVSGNNHDGVLTGTLATFWANTQDTYHYNILNGHTRYTHATLADIRVPANLDGTFNTTAESGYSKDADYPSGRWHNYAETKHVFESYSNEAVPEIYAAEVAAGITHFYSADGSTVNEIGYSGHLESIGNIIFMNILTAGQHKDLIVLSTPPTYAESRLIYYFTRTTDFLLDGTGALILDGDGLPIVT